MFAAGLVLFQLLGGKLQHDLFQEQVLSGDVSEKYPGVDVFEGMGGDLLRGMMDVDPVLRLTADEVLDHEWFTSL